MWTTIGWWILIGIWVLLNIQILFKREIKDADNDYVMGMCCVNLFLGLVGFIISMVMNSPLLIISVGSLIVGGAIGLSYDLRKGLFICLITGGKELRNLKDKKEK
jgi:hypothetical protein